MTRHAGPRAITLLYEAHRALRAGLLPGEPSEEGAIRLVETILTCEPAPGLATVEAAGELLARFREGLLELCPDLPERIRADLEAVESLLELASYFVDGPEE
jgi:hypothetical protein